MQAQKRNPCRVMQVSEIVQEVFDYLHREPLCKYNEEFDRYEFSNSWYWIDASDICTAKDVGFWISHLAEKEWVTKQHIQDFAKAIEDRGV